MHLPVCNRAKKLRVYGRPMCVVVWAQMGDQSRLCLANVVSYLPSVDVVLLMVGCCCLMNVTLKSLYMSLTPMHLGVLATILDCADRPIYILSESCATVAFKYKFLITFKQLQRYS